MKDLRILLVDDDGAIHKLLKEMLRLWGFEAVGVASDGQEGVEAFKIFEPDLVIMDMEMPKMDGYTTSKAIREMDGSVPIILLTGVPQSRKAKRAVEQGYAQFIIPKPFDAEQLRMAILETTRAMRKKESSTQGAVA